MDHTDVAVAKISELRDGEMKQVSANGVEVLLSCVGGKIHAVGAHCTHYGAPLVDGVLSGERVVCPWHHACFNVRTGDLEEPPAFDALTRYEVKIDDEQIIVRVPEGASDRRTPLMTRRETQDERLFVIAGGGAAGYTAAQTLRQDGFTGRLLMITREKHLPYDRPNLSKEYLQGNAEPAWLPLRSKEFFAEHDIEIIQGRQIQNIDAGEKTVTFADGETIRCDALLVATGGEPRQLPFKLESQSNVFLLRSYDDSDAIIAAAEKGKRAVVIGASFIGMEAASSLIARGCDVTVVAPDQLPFEKVLGARIGQLFQHVHEKQGVKFKLGVSVTGFIGPEKVTAVTLQDGEQLDADIVVVGIGVKPATGLLRGLSLHEDGGVIVDEYMRAANGVYAAGDIAYFPNPITNEYQRIEHWRTAMQQGRVAAHNMAGKNVSYTSVPFFWTRQFDVGLLYVGHAQEWDEILYQGDVAGQEFVALYVRGNRVLAAAGMNRDRDMAAIEELIRLDRMPTADLLRDGSTDFLQLLKTSGSDDNSPAAQNVANDVIASGVTPQIQLG